MVSHVSGRAHEWISTEAIDPEGSYPSADFPPDLASPCGNPLVRRSVSIDPARPLVTVPNLPEPTAERMIGRDRNPSSLS
jgi:hypothetical protein